MQVRLRSVSIAAAAAALALAACGSGDDGSRDAAAGTAGGTTDTVSVADVKGTGEILVDSSGLALYAADEEADGQVRCTDGCTSFWEPLEPDANAPTAGPGVPDLGLATRPDGSEQVTADGRLLYTFAEDSAGQVNGDGFEDDFGDQHLTWHVVRVTGAGASTPDTAGTAAGGRSTDPGNTGGLPDYGYGG
jgi:predicted lipoprotein with Yx(FWY)xxD motif